MIQKEEKKVMWKHGNSGSMKWNLKKRRHETLTKYEMTRYRLKMVLITRNSKDPMHKSWSTNHKHAKKSNQCSQISTMADISGGFWALRHTHFGRYARIFSQISIWWPCKVMVWWDRQHWIQLRCKVFGHMWLCHLKLCAYYFWKRKVYYLGFKRKTLSFVWFTLRI